MYQTLSNLSYDERLGLKKLDKERLAFRCLRADLLICYKILYTRRLFHISQVKITRGTSFELIVSNSRLDTRADFISVRIN